MPLSLDADRPDQVPALLRSAAEVFHAEANASDADAERWRKAAVVLETAAAELDAALKSAESC